MERRWVEWLRDFGRQVKQRRQDEGLSQQEFAGKLGISRTYLSQIERGQASGLRLDMIGKVSVRLGFGAVSEALGIYTAGDAESITPEPLPDGLAELEVKLKLGGGDIEFLRTLSFRGRKPQTVEQWEMAFNIIEARSRVWGE